MIYDIRYILHLDEPRKQATESLGHWTCETKVSLWIFVSCIFSFMYRGVLEEKTTHTSCTHIQSHVSGKKKKKKKKNACTGSHKGACGDHTNRLSRVFGGVFP